MELVYSVERNEFERGDSLNLLNFVICFQKQISCFVEYKNKKGKENGERQELSRNKL